MQTSMNLEQLVDRVMAELQKQLEHRASLTSAQGRPAAVATDQRDATVTTEAKHSVSQPSGEGHLEPTSGITSFINQDSVAVPNPKWPEGLRELVSSTPARIGVWRTGTRPLTSTMLKLRIDHAAAVDTVYGEVSQALLDEFSLFTVETCFGNTENYLKRPDKGRIITESGIELIKKKCKFQPQVQIVVSDGLSANAIEANLRDIYPALLDSLRSHGLTWGTPFFVRGGRVAVMDHIGELLQPEVFVLLIGERPGLVTSESMSAYMCYRPRRGTVESDRTVISNIHKGGTPPVEAGAHIGTILKKMIEQKASGVKLMI